MEEVHERIHHRLAESTDIPCAMVRRLIRDLPGVHDLVSHRRLRGASGPLGPTSPTHRLSASPGALGPHDFAVCNDRRSSRGIITSIASRLTIVTTRSPLLPRRDKRKRTMILRKTEDKYFSREGLTRLLIKRTSPPPRANQFRPKPLPAFGFCLFGAQNL